MGFSGAVFIVTLAICFIGGHSSGKNFAVLIQGSKGWYNYCSASSICHAYQTLRKSGMPEENIIVMMYDDVANNSRNPSPGNLYNSPNGSEVYHGVKIDYRGKEITAKTFLAVLRGDQEAIVKLIDKKGRVVESGPNDNIFVYYSDHGTMGWVAMPSGYPLYAYDLNQTLTEMYEKKRYANVVFYMEACYSGSMFDKVLSPEINVYAMTATSPDTEGWMIYCDFDKFGACYGIEFECNWLGDTDFHNVDKRTFDEQFKETKKIMTGSVPHQYGDVTIDKDVLDVFFGKRQGTVSSKSHISVNDPPKRHCEHPDGDQVFSRVPINMAKFFDLKARLKNTPSHSELRPEIERELASYDKLLDDTNSLFLEIAKPFYEYVRNDELATQIFDIHYQIKSWDCYKKAVNTLLSMCPDLDINSNGASAKKMVALVHLCNNHQKRDVLESVKQSASMSPACRPL